MITFLLASCQCTFCDGLEAFGIFPPPAARDRVANKMDFCACAGARASVYVCMYAHVHHGYQRERGAALDTRLSISSQSFHSERYTYLCLCWASRSFIEAVSLHGQYLTDAFPTHLSSSEFKVATVRSASAEPKYHGMSNRILLSKLEKVFKKNSIVGKMASGFHQQ